MNPLSKIGGIFIFFSVWMCILAVSVSFILITENQTKIIAQNDYITEVLLCNPINLVDDFGTDIIKEKK